MISRRRIIRWRKKRESNKELHNGKPGPEHPLHKLLPEEKRAVLDMAGRGCIFICTCCGISLWNNKDKSSLPSPFPGLC